MKEEYLEELSTKAQQAAHLARIAENKAEQLIVEGEKRMAKQDGKKGNENKGPDPLQSNSEQAGWWQGLVANISNSLQIGSSGFDDKGDQDKKILENKGLRSQIEEPKPTAKNIEMPPEEDQAKFTWKGLWSKGLWSGVSNTVTSVFKAEETASQAESLSEKSSSNSASDPNTEKELPEQSPNKSVAQGSPNTSIFSKIRNGLASLWRKGAEQNKEGSSTGSETSAKEGQEVVVSTNPPTTTIEERRNVSFGGVDVRLVQRYLNDKIEFKKVKTSAGEVGRRPQSVLKVRHERVLH